MTTTPAADPPRYDPFRAIRERIHGTPTPTPTPTPEQPDTEETP